MEPNSGSPGPFSSSPWFRTSSVSSVSSHCFSPERSPLAAQLPVTTKGRPLIPKTNGADTLIHQLHAQLVVVQMHQLGGSSLSSMRSMQKQSTRVSPYRRSRSLRFFGPGRPQSLSRRPLARTSSQGLVAPEHFSSRSSKHKMGSGNTLPRNLTSHLREERSASLRKAESLKAVLKACLSDRDEDENQVPTQPATPCYPSLSTHGDDLSSMPILSPNLNVAPRFPLSAETTAKIRIGKYKEREGRTNDHDHIRMKYIGGNLLSLPQDWINWELLLGLGRAAREEHLSWLFHFLPEIDSGSSSSSFSSTSSGISFGSVNRYSGLNSSRQNLVNQLTTSPETRFHAAWMFLRYHQLLGMNRTDKVTAQNLPLYASSGVWDVTMASLAISVKFHRDFLFPLAPIESGDYLDISPHDMDYDDFEYAQRSILGFFSYELGITPQPILDQLWIALPSLRELLGFDGGWNQAKKETWRLLFSSLYERDVMRFSVSVLTITALCKALVIVLSQRYYYDSDWNSLFNFARSEGGDQRGYEVAEKFKITATEDAEGVILDIQAVVGVSEIEADVCRRWLDLNAAVPGL